MVSALESGLIGSGPSPGGGHTAVKRKNPAPLPVFAASNFASI